MTDQTWSPATYSDIAVAMDDKDVAPDFRHVGCATEISIKDETMCCECGLQIRFTDIRMFHDMWLRDNIEYRPKVNDVWKQERHPDGYDYLRPATPAEAANYYRKAREWHHKKSIGAFD